MDQTSNSCKQMLHTTTTAVRADESHNLDGQWVSNSASYVRCKVSVSPIRPGHPSIVKPLDAPQCGHSKPNTMHATYPRLESLVVHPKGIRLPLDSTTRG